MVRISCDAPGNPPHQFFSPAVSAITSNEHLESVLRLTTRFSTHLVGLLIELSYSEARYFISSKRHWQRSLRYSSHLSSSKKLLLRLDVYISC